MGEKEKFSNNNFKASILACLVTLVASLALIGWGVEVAPLRSLIPGAVPVNPLTAIGFILLSAAFFLTTTKQSSQKTLLINSILVFIALAGMYVFLDLFFQFAIHIDQLLFKEKLGLHVGSRFSGRMAANAALSFVLCSVAMFIMVNLPSRASWYQMICLTVVFIAAFSFLGYLYRAPEFVNVLPFFTMAPISAICFVIMAAALLITKSGEGIVGELTNKYAGSLVARYLIPAAIVLPVLIGYVRLWGHWRKAFSTEFGVTILVWGFVILFVAAVWIVVILLNKNDVQDKQKEIELSLLNGQLTAANRELASVNLEVLNANEDLTSSNEEFAAVNEQLAHANQTIAKQKDERLNRVLDSSNDVIWSFDLTGKGENYLSHSAERIYGEPLEILVKRPRFWLEHLHPEDRSIKDASQRRLELYGFTECTYRIIMGGGTRWIHDRLTLIKDADGNQRRLEGIATDVTSIKDAQRILDQERNLLRALIDNIPDFIFVRDAQLRSIINNKASIDLLGATNEGETLGKTAMDYFGEKGRTLMEDDHLVFSSGQAILNKEEVVVMHGRPHTMLTSKIPLRDDAGNVVALIGIGRDITAKREQEEALNQYRINLDIIFNNTTDTFLLLDNQAKVVLFNRAYSDFLYDTSQIRPFPGMQFMEVVSAHRKEIAPALLERALNGERILTEVEHISSLKRKLYHLIRFEPTSHDGKVTHISISGVDITSRKEKENLLKQSEANLKSILDSAPDSFVLINRAFEVVILNDSYRRLVSNISGREVTIGSSIFELVPVHQRANFKSMLDKVDLGEMVHYDVKNEEAEIWLDITINPVTTEQAEFIGYCIVSRDITIQKKAEMVIQSSEERFRALVENGDDLSVISDFRGNVLFASSNLKRVLGYETLESGYSAILHQEDKRHSVNRILWLKENPGKPCPLTMRILHMDGSWRWMEGTATNLSHLDSIKGIASTFRDVTSRKMMEEELSRNQYFLNKASEAAKIGYWTSGTDTVDSKLTWSREVFRIFQLDEKDFDGTLEAFSRLVHPDDREKVIEMSRLAGRGDSHYNIDHRIIRPSGEIRWVNERAQVVRNEHNEAILMVGIVQDITERKMIEDSLREYNQRYEILSKATNDVIWDWDIVRDKVVYNHGMQTVLGYAEAEIKSTGEWWGEQFHPEDHDRTFREMKEVFRKKLTTWDSRYRYKTAEGRYKNIHDRAFVVYDDRGFPVRMIGAMQDVTEQTESMEEIRKLSLVASKTDNSVIITDAETRIEWVNEGFTRLTGYTLEEVKGQSTNKFLEGPETDPSIVSRMREGLKGGKAVTEELIGYSKTGRKFWLRLSITPVVDEAQQVKNFIAIQSDISEQKEYERSIIAIAHELASLIEYANVPIFGVDEKGNIIEWNRVCTELTGYSRAEAFGNNLLDRIISPGDRSRFNEMIKEVLTGVPVSNFEISISSKSGQSIILLMSVSPGKEGTDVPGITIVAQNITELSEYRLELERKVERRTRELNAALNKEKELVEMKSRFVSIASHEFRTPLSSISLASGFIKKYRDRMAPEEVDKKLDGIETQVHHMSYLLDDVLTISKSDAGKLKVNWSILNIRTLFEGLALEVTQSNHASHRINFQITSPIKSFRSDEKLMRNIIINLLTNAIKFSPDSDEVDLTVRCQGSEMVIVVRDFGIGIPSGDIDKLFEAFYRAENVSMISGTGLGLSIVKKAVELLGGEIKLKSELKKGTEFTVTLPLRND